MKITFPDTTTIVKWRSVALAASILFSILELANIQTAEKSGYIAATSQKEIEIAKLSLSIAADARLLASKTNNNHNKSKYLNIYAKNICKVEQLVKRSAQPTSKQHPPATSCTTNQRESIKESAIIESELASNIDAWEKDAEIAAIKQAQHTSTALKLNYLATILLLLFLALDLFGTYGTSRHQQD